MKMFNLRKLLFTLGLSILAVSASAQSMSDEQVIKYVQQEQEKGATQQQIVTKLLQRGVTTDQLRRIRKKVQAEQENLGAQDLLGRGQQQSRLRQRQEKQEKAEPNQKRNQYMIQSQMRAQNRYY